MPPQFDAYELQRWLMQVKTAIEDLSSGLGTISAGQVTSGVFDPARIPELPFTKITLTGPRLLGRSTAGNGPAEEIQVAGGLTLSGGILSMAGLPSGFVIGDLLYAQSATQLARLADVAVGSYLRSGGVATAPLWSTLTLPNAVTAGSVVFASAANTYGQDNANLFWDAANVRLGIGTATPSAQSPLQIVCSANNAERVDLANTSTGTGARAGLIARADVSQVLFDAYSSTNLTSPVTGIAGASIIDVRAITTTFFLLRTSAAPIVFAPSSTEAMRLTTGGALGIGVTVPTAVLHLKAGTATAGTAPLKLTSGALLTAPAAGAIEFLTDAYYGTITTGPARKQFMFTDGDISGLTGTLGVAHGGTGTGTAFTAGSVVFAGASGVYAQDNANFFWDGSNHRLGLGTTSLIANYRITLDTIAGSSAAMRLRNGTATRYRNDWSIDPGGVTVNAFDDTGGVYLPFGFTGLQVILSIVNAGGTFEHSFGKGNLRYAVLDGLRLAGSDTGNTIYQPSGVMGIRTASGALTIEAGGANSLIFQTNGATGLTMTSAKNIVLVGAITTYNNVATAGWGVPAIYGSGRSAAQTAAVASVATYTVGAADGSFLVSANVNVTTSTTHNFAVQVTYTDETNTAQTLVLNFSQPAGVLTIAITNVTGAGPYEGVPLHIRCKASTAITIKTAGSFVAVTYNVEGLIQQVA